MNKTLFWIFFWLNEREEERKNTRACQSHNRKTKNSIFMNWRLTGPMHIIHFYSSDWSAFIFSLSIFPAMMCDVWADIEFFWNWNFHFKFDRINYLFPTFDTVYCLCVSGAGIFIFSDAHFVCAQCIYVSHKLLLFGV